MAKKINLVTVLGVGLAVLGIALLVHHFAKHGYLADARDVMNHEFFAVAFGALGAGLLIGGGQLQA